MLKINKLAILTFLLLFSSQAAALDLKDKQLTSSQLTETQIKNSQLEKSDQIQAERPIEKQNTTEAAAFPYPTMRSSLRQKGTMELGAALAEIGRGDLIGANVPENSFDRGTFEIPLGGRFAETMFEDNLSSEPVPFRTRTRKP